MPLCNYTHYQMSSGNLIISTGQSPLQCIYNSDITFDIETASDGSKQLYTNTPLYVKKRHAIGPSYKGWKDADIAKDQAINIINKHDYSIAKVGW